MRYFKVEEQLIAGAILQGEVDKNGEQLYLPDTVETNEEKSLGYIVYELDEDNNIIDTIYGYLDIDEIIKDFAKPEWINRSWEEN